jgi:integrase
MPTRTLTDALLRSLKCEPGKRCVEVRDEGRSGLEIRVWESGAKTWRLHYTRRSDGRRRVVKLGTYPALTLKDARLQAKRLQVGIEDEGTRADPAAARQERKIAETFTELAEEWIERHANPNKSRRALQDDRSMLDRHILPHIGSMKAGEISKRDVIGLLDAAVAAPDARRKSARGDQGTRRKLTHRPNRVFELVRAIFRWGVGRDIVKMDPTLGLSAPIKREKARERELSPDEIRLLWRVLEAAPRGRETLRAVKGQVPLRRATAIAMQLALVTGQRIGEVSGIAASELDLNELAPVWKLPDTRTKNREPHRVPLSPLALHLVEEAQKLAVDSPWLFPSPSGDGPIDPHAATKALDRARPAIGISDFRVHDLRRTAATRMEEMGVQPHVISHILNHVSVSKASITKKVYSRYTYDQEKREALNAWATRLERIVAGDVKAISLR